MEKKLKKANIICLFRLSKNLFFDSLAEVKEAPKTNKSNSSAYDGTVEFDLCSKSKHLAKQGFLQVLSAPCTSSDLAALGHLLLKDKAFLNLCFDGLGVA